MRATPCGSITHAGAQVRHHRGSTGKNSRQTRFIVLIRAVGKDYGHLDDAVEAGTGGFEHVRHVAQRLADLLSDRAGSCVCTPG
jgi:hypothetical protein